MINWRKANRIYRKSLEILEKVQLKNGGCIATPRGERYPYIYPRDHAMITLGFLSAGLNDRARRALDFIFNCQCRTGEFPQRIDEKGNDASYKPVQIDGTALTLYTFSEYVRQTDDIKFAEKHWHSAKRAVQYILDNFHEDKELVYTPNSIHEFPPTEQGLEIWANCVCCAALQRMYELCVRLNHVHQEWKTRAVENKEGILKYMWNSRIDSFVKNIRVKESSSVLVDPDASKIAICEFGILEDNDERVISTVQEIQTKLWNKDLGGICRYPKYEGRNNGGWGPWPHFTLMVCRYFIRLKEKRKADQYLNWVINIAHKDMLPEHISTVGEFQEYVADFTEAGLLRKDRLIMIANAKKSPMFRRGVAYITTPLAWPHAEFIRTLNLYKTFFKK